MHTTVLWLFWGHPRWLCTGTKFWVLMVEEEKDQPPPLVIGHPVRWPFTLRYWC